MDRLQLVREATSRAIEEIEDVGACSDSRYAQLKKLHQEEAVKTLATEFLWQAAENLEVRK